MLLLSQNRQIVAIKMKDSNHFKVHILESLI